MPWQSEKQTLFVRSLRRSLTDVERRLWKALRSAQLADYKFRRQHPIGPYVADFACLSARMVVELDGGQHNESAHDAVRDAYLRAEGWRVLRFWNNEANTNIEGVLMQILLELQPAR